MITINSQEEYDSAKNRYEEAIQKSCQWEYDLEKKYKILKEETHTSEMGKEQQMEPLAVFFIEDFNSKTTSKTKEKDSL